MNKAYFWKSASKSDLKSDDYFGVYLAHFSAGIPEFRENRIDIPLTNGTIDASTALSLGIPKYKDREVLITFYTLAGWEDFAMNQVRSRLANYLHGQNVYVSFGVPYIAREGALFCGNETICGNGTLCTNGTIEGNIEHTEYEVYYGRAVMQEFTPSKNGGAKIVIKITCNPFAELFHEINLVGIEAYSSYNINIPIYYNTTDKVDAEEQKITFNFRNENSGTVQLELPNGELMSILPNTSEQVELSLEYGDNNLLVHSYGEEYDINMPFSIRYKEAFI